MSFLHYQNADLYFENVRIKDIAEKFNTPTYIYSRAAIQKNWQQFKNAFQEKAPLICYAVKANSNLHLLRLLAKLNAGFDIVSLGELERVLKAGGDVRKIVFSGVGKRQNEIDYAIKKGIFCFNVESAEELKRINSAAIKASAQVNITLRINPNIDPKTHTYMTTGLNKNKFGMDSSQVIELAKNFSEFPQLKLIGIACHLGSQMMSLAPLLSGLEHLLAIANEIQNAGTTLAYLNIGGGLGIKYGQENPPTIDEYGKQLQHKLQKHSFKLIIEPGRALIGNAGILVTRVEYIKTIKQQRFAIVDAGMNDFLRPALYDAWQPILPAKLRSETKQRYDIVGPVCESSDFLGKDRDLAIHQHDLLVIDGAGAYGSSMSSNYNSRPRAAEVLVENTSTRLIRRRETIEDLLAGEYILLPIENETE